MYRCVMRSLRAFPAGLALAAAAALAAWAQAADPDPRGKGPERDLPNWIRPPPAPGHAYPECVCVNRGERVPLGGTACLRVGGREFTARCSESVNVSVWREIAEGCAPGPGA